MSIVAAHPAAFYSASLAEQIEAPEPPAAPFRDFPEVTTIVPALVDLQRRARRADHDDWHAYAHFKARMTALVGWFARHPDPRVRSSAAYDLCHRQILSGW